MSRSVSRISMFPIEQVKEQPDGPEKRRLAKRLARTL